MSILTPTEIIQVSDTYLIRFNCPKCDLEQLEGYPVMSCGDCKADLSTLAMRFDIHFRLVSGSKRSRKHVGKRMVRRLIELYGLQCAYCYLDLTGIEYHVDHVVPLAVGGTNNESNLVLACPPCNLRAGSLAFPSLGAKRRYLASK